MLHAVGRTEFDHAVVMVRDRLDALAPHFERQGFHLSEKAVHNLGSCNRLIVLEGTYVELLGWPPGAPPARKEIADSPLGLEALVFRTYDAEATYRRLLEAGFAVNPVQELTRAAQWQGREVQARFHTVRFAEQPIPGIRCTSAAISRPSWSGTMNSCPIRTAPAASSASRRTPPTRRPWRSAWQRWWTCRPRPSPAAGTYPGQPAAAGAAGSGLRHAAAAHADLGKPRRRALHAGYRRLSGTHAAGFAPAHARRADGAS